MLDPVPDTDPIKHQDVSPQRSNTMRSPSPAKWRRSDPADVQESASTPSMGVRARSKSPAKPDQHNNLRYYSARSRFDLTKEKKPLVDFALGEEGTPARGRATYESLAGRRQGREPPTIDVRLAQYSRERGEDRPSRFVLDAKDQRPLNQNKRPQDKVDLHREQQQQDHEPPRDTSGTYSSSLYSENVSDETEENQRELQEVRTRVEISPLRGDGNAVGLGISPWRRPTVLELYSAWKQGCRVELQEGQVPQEKQSDQLADTTGRHVFHDGNEHKASDFTPLTPYFSTKDMPASKKAFKTLTGDGGWLERTQATGEKQPVSPKKIGLLEGLKIKARQLVVSEVLPVCSRSVNLVAETLAHQIRYFGLT
jgi:hypothetical protein